MRTLPPLLLCLLFTTPALAVELFGVPLANANKGSLGIAARAAGATLLDTGKPEVYELFDSSAVLSGSQRLYLGFDVQDNRFAFAEYHIAPLLHRHMLSKLKRKYGEPKVDKGRFISDQLYHWEKSGISINYQRQWGCRCSELRYTLAAKSTEIMKQHQQIQKQRQGKHLDSQQGSY